MDPSMPKGMTGCGIQIGYDSGVRAWVAVTDKDWYRFLAQRPHLDEVNFWQPGGSREFRTLTPGEPFLFKLH